MRIIAYILYALAAIFLGAAAFFFWKLKIPSVIADLNGKTARRDIAAQREDRENKRKSAKKKMVQSKQYDGFGAGPAPAASAEAPRTAQSNAYAAQNDSLPTAPLMDEAEEETRPIASAAMTAPLEEDEQETRPIASAARMTSFEEDEQETRPIAPASIQDQPTEPTLTEGVTASIIRANAKPVLENDESTTRPGITQPIYRAPQYTNPQAVYAGGQLLEEEESETRPLSSNQTGTRLSRNNLRSAAPEGETVLLNAHPDTQMNDASTQAIQVQTGKRVVQGFITGETVMMVHTDEVIPVTSY